MTINSNRYVNITSGVGAGGSVGQRKLIARLFTSNIYLPVDTDKEFTSAAAVGAYFGTTSEEYKRASFYFGWVSKNITSPQSISYSRWVETAVSPRIWGDNSSVVSSLTAWQGITNGSFGLNILGTTNTFTALDFSGATSLADVATIVQTAIRTASGTMWTSATVTYDATRASFNFVGGSTGDATIAYVEGVTGTPLGTHLGWSGGDNLVISNGSAVEAITDTLDQSASRSDNFGSFLFIPTLTIDQHAEAAEWNAGQNVKYQYMVPTAYADATSWSAALIGYGGTGLTISSVAGEYPEMAPMMILAATNYLRVNSVQNYMFQKFPLLSPSVSTDLAANTLDPLRVNYIGLTQTAGQQLAFYQRGVLMGGATDAKDMNTYANEQWLKSVASAALLNLITQLAKISANGQGRSQILSTLQNVVNLAINNGTISVDKILTEDQKQFITQQTNDPNAWYQVQNVGYWLDCVIVPVEVNDGVEYHAEYTLIYSKDDDVRKINGTHELI